SPRPTVRIGMIKAVLRRPIEPELGVSINGDSRVYSIPFLSGREIVNDTVGGVPIAVTWCPLCFTGIGYNRTIDGVEHTFGVSGKLILNALVMYDHQSGSLWSQFLSRGVKGEFAGRDLEIVPIVQTTYGQWLREHPDTAVLDKGRRGAFDQYDGYYIDDDAGVIGEANVDDRLARKDKVVGLGFENDPKAYPLSALDVNPVVNDRVAGEDVVVFFQPSTETALVYNRVVDGRRLEFDQVIGGDGTVLLRDRVTGTRFLPFTGRAVDGELAGAQLERVHSVVSFWFAWSDFFPEAELYEL
ncbi:MAG: DUF3179 domain-containing protein, partial [Chloroflexi bacterium]|nr:DUF3179 domain-containing protein [Chloroflexota bacterium]